MTRTIKPESIGSISSSVNSDVRKAIATIKDILMRYETSIVEFEASGGVRWATIDLTHSKLSDIPDRKHSALQEISDATSNTNDKARDKHIGNSDYARWNLHTGKQADDTSTSTEGEKHVTDVQVKKYNDHGADTSIHHTLEAIQDDIAGLLTQGNAITLTYNDGANTLTVAVVAAAASADVSGTAGATYTSTEQGIINGLVSSLNDLKGKMRTAGLLVT
jgi:hypothetical protein